MADYTIQELLSSETLQGLTLVAGKSGLDRRIGNVNTIENLDSYDWLRAGDFLLTTGFIYKDDPSQLVSMVERLSQINCAGLGFKMMRYFEALPEEMLRRAEELNFPILLIPLKYSLADVSNEITNHLRGVEDFWFFKYLSILNLYNDAILNGKGVNGIIDTLYHFIHTPVVLVDSRWRLLAMCDPEGALSELKLNTRGFPQSFMDSVPKMAVGKANLLTRSFPTGKNELIVRITQLEDASSKESLLLPGKASLDRPCPVDKAGPVLVVEVGFINVSVAVHQSGDSQHPLPLQYVVALFRSDARGHSENLFSLQQNILRCPVYRYILD